MNSAPRFFRSHSIGLAVLATALVGVAGLPARAQDPAKDPAARPAPKPTDVFKSLFGTWEGTVRTWFEPGKLADESKVKGEISPGLNGQSIHHTYTGAMQGKPRRGEETIAWNTVTKRFQSSWVDTFHMPYGLLFSEGEATPRGFTVKGKYDVKGGAPWGWRTDYALVDADHLTITAYNISPDGQENKAVETIYQRVK